MCLYLESAWKSLLPCAESWNCWLRSALSPFLVGRPLDAAWSLLLEFLYPSFLTVLVSAEEACRNPVVPRLRSLREDSGQSNGVLLTVEIRIKLVPWLVFQSACYRILRMVTTKIMSFAVGEKVIIFLSNFFWQKLVFSWFFSTSFSSYVCTSTCLILILPGVLQIIFCTGFSLS